MSATPTPGEDPAPGTSAGDLTAEDAALHAEQITTRILRSPQEDRRHTAQSKRKPADAAADVIEAALQLEEEEEEEEEEEDEEEAEEGEDEEVGASGRGREVAKDKENDDEDEGSEDLMAVANCVSLYVHATSHLVDNEWAAGVEQLPATITYASMGYGSGISNVVMKAAADALRDMGATCQVEHLWSCAATAVEKAWLPVLPKELAPTTSCVFEASDKAIRAGGDT